MDETNAIRAEGLEKRYLSGTRNLIVFQNLTFSIQPAERVALTGESGAGKSTLLHILAGLDRPSSGEVFLGGQQITGLDEEAMAEKRNREIGFVWQMNTLLPEFTALENVMMPLLIRGMSRGQAAQEAEAVLNETGLQGRLHHRAGELSGGEQQRAVLARALVVKPRFLFADEPTGNLDAETGNRIMDLLEEVQENNSLTCLYVTHNREFAERAGRIIKLEAGRLIPQDKECHV